MPPILEVRDLHVRFPVFGGVLLRRTSEVHAVDGVSFTLAQGEPLGWSVNPARKTDRRPLHHPSSSSHELSGQDRRAILYHSTWHDRPRALTARDAAYRTDIR